MTFSQIRAFIEGNILSRSASLPQHIKEQVTLRAYLCRNCLKAGKCLSCKCPTPKMFYAPSKVDPLGRFAEFFSPAQWEALKLHYRDYCEFFEALSKGEAQSIQALERTSD